MMVTVHKLTSRDYSATVKTKDDVVLIKGKAYRDHYLMEPSEEADKIGPKVGAFKVKEGWLLTNSTFKKVKRLTKIKLIEAISNEQEN